MPTVMYLTLGHLTGPVPLLTGSSYKLGIGDRIKITRFEATRFITFLLVGYNYINVYDATHSGARSALCPLQSCMAMWPVGVQVALREAESEWKIHVVINSGCKDCQIVRTYGNNNNRSFIRIREYMQ